MKVYALALISILTALQTSCAMNSTQTLDQTTNEAVARILDSNPTYKARVIPGGSVIIEDLKIREKIAPELKCK